MSKTLTPDDINTHLMGWTYHFGVGYAYLHGQAVQSQSDVTKLKFPRLFCTLILTAEIGSW